MNDHDLMVKLERIINDLVKVDGVDGSLIVDDMGNILTQRILQDIDVDLFGPMAHVITSSSKRLLSSSNQGTIQRVLVESVNGKALFLHLGNVQLIVLMKNSANVGLILVSSKRSAEEIITLTKDLKPDISEPKYECEKPLIAEEISIKEKPNTTIAEEIKIPDEVSEPLTTNESSQEVLIEAELSKQDALKVQEEVPIADENDVVSDFETQEISEDESETVPIIEDVIPEPRESIPIIKPPIAFPEIKKVTDIPENKEDRSDLILDIYEAIFKAMSIGASKIMGVAPARGLTQKFLPFDQCHKLLDSVNVKSNSTIDFKQIRENASKIPIEDRESQFIEDFTKILDIVTDNYGKVMGYGAFRGMVRPEFKKITDSYGPVMNKLGITNKLHPEISELFE
jgi:predicted regulator of Ras-like GTPase activity (Roadblock/LC7/MglB family)